ncbi:hypothetical protein [Flavobacterium psychrotolerans]|uniref:Uncharacterized protein n=1 Tax=Flavobacterium psychrotolerans TaxID=2169410 RepID=A0A2U1JMV8_9FLAO|nr:hypothetical protein [Flavobacterium psychrotolerans]PWA06501.1 hypothetical protein DB895_03535 [Flavobacterium psychrotolerans]
MTPNKLLLFFLFLFVNISFGQEKTNSNIIKKDIEIIKGNDIYDVPVNMSSFSTALAIKKYNNKNLVYYYGKFFSSDTLNIIKNINDYELEIIKIPDNFTKDIQSIIYLKKVVK